MMKTLLALLALCCLISTAAFAQGGSTKPIIGFVKVGSDQIAVGKDGITRVLWQEKEGDFNTFGYYQVTTFDSNLKPQTGGGIYGSYSGLGLSDPKIAVGPNNDTHLGWYNKAQTYLSEWFFDGNYNYAGSTVVNFVLPPESGNQYVLQNIAMDAGDNIWYDLSESFQPLGQQPFNDAVLRPFNSQGTPVPISIVNGADYSQFSLEDTAIRNDGVPFVLGFGTGAINPNGALNIDALVPVNGILGVISGNFQFEQIFSHSAVPGSLSPNWLPWQITTTPNNHTQVWWSDRNATSMEAGLWDIAPNGTVTFGPAISGTNWFLLAVAGCQFTGGDNKIRELWYNSSGNTYLLQTCDPTNNFALANSSTIFP